MATTEKLDELLRVCTIIQSGYLAGRNTIEDCVEADDQVRKYFAEIHSTALLEAIEIAEGKLHSQENITNGTAYTVPGVNYHESDKVLRDLITALKKKMEESVN